MTDLEPMVAEGEFDMLQEVLRAASLLRQLATPEQILDAVTASATAMIPRWSVEIRRHQACAVPGEAVFPIAAGPNEMSLVVGAPTGVIGASLSAGVRLLCEEASIAIDLANTRAAADRTAALHEAILQLSVARPPGATLQTIVRQAAAVLRMDAAYVMLLDESGHRLVMTTAFGVTTGTFHRATCAVDELLPGAAIRERRVRCLRDTADFEQARFSNPEGLRTVMCAPMFADDELIGVLVTSHRRVRELSADDRRLMAALASAAAVAIANARLHEARDEAMRQLERTTRELELRSEQLEASRRFEQQLASRVAAGAPLKDLVTAAAAGLDADVFVLDSNLRPVGDPPSRALGVHEAVSQLLESRDAGADLAEPLGTSVSLEGSPHETLVLPVSAERGELPVAHVAVVRSESHVGLDHGAATVAATIIALYVLRERAALEAEVRLTGGLFEDILADDGSGDAGLCRKAALLGYDLSGNNAVVALAPHPSDGCAATMGVRTILEAMRRITPRLGCHAASFEHDGVVFVLLTEVGPLNSKHIADAVDRIEREIAFHRGRTGGASIAFAGPRPTIAGIREAANEARYALRIVEITGSRSSAAVDVADLGVWSLLGRVNDPRHLMAFARSELGPLLDHDDNHHAELVSTLRGMVKANYHYRSAAEALFAHPNTLRYRMARISELTGLDLADSDSRLRAELALRILDLLGD